MYLFECILNDGTIIKQTPEDQSPTDPTKSAFYDVELRIGEVMFFGVFSSEHSYVVDLRDGHFEIDGVPFQIDGVVSPDLQLIYFRRQRIWITGGTETAHTTEYHLGWSGLVNGVQIRRTITFG